MNKDGWRKVKLGDIIIKMKKADHGAKDGLDNGKYPFFTNSTTDKKLYFNEYDYDEPIILANTGGAAYFKYCDEKCSGSRDLFVFKCIDDIDTKFLYYVLHDNTEKINEEMFKGVAIKHLQKNDFLNMEIDLPPYAEQLQIADALSHLDSLISVKGGGVTHD